MMILKKNRIDGNKFMFIPVIMFCFLCPKLSAQVTIGSFIEPEKAALLDMKDKAADSINETANRGGLGLPRVRLVNRNTLEPFIPVTDQDWIANANKLKEHHAGLMVYNINVPPVKDDSKADEMFRQGIYIWNGERWKEAQFGKESFFPLPLFNLDLTKGEHSINLYKEYDTQFSKSGRLYAADELDYVVTFCDTTVLKIDSIGVKNDLYYTVKETPFASPTPAVFVNVELVVK
ncbi:MAG: hypothetical protein LBU22_15625 [Dysgonamonadaceae bacterium]|jgi:hypothetical protein|nr:hypothetical protein [Dysgonamonadaceae bacterium]